MKLPVFSLILIGVWNIADCDNEYKSQQPHIIRAENIGAYLQTSRSGSVPIQVASWMPIVKNISTVSPVPKQEPVTRRTLEAGMSITTYPVGHNFNSQRQYLVSSSRPNSGPFPTQNHPKQIPPKDATTTAQPPLRPPVKIQVSSQPYAYRKASARPYSSSTTVVPNPQLKVNYIRNETSSPTALASFLLPQRYRPSPGPTIEKPPLIATSPLLSPPTTPTDHGMAYADEYQSSYPNYQSNYFQNTASRDYVPLVTTTKTPPINPLQALAPLFSGILGHTADQQGLTVLANDYYKKNNLTEPKHLIKYITHLEGERAPAEPKVTEVPILVRTHAPPPRQGSAVVSRPLQPQAGYQFDSYAPNLPKASTEQYPSNDFSGSFQSFEGTRYKEEQLVSRHVPVYQSQMIPVQQQSGYYHDTPKKNPETEILQQLMEQFHQNKAEEVRHRQYPQDESHVRHSNYPAHEYREQVVPYMDNKPAIEQHASIRHYAPQGDHRISIHYVNNAPAAPEPDRRPEMPHLPKPGSDEFDEVLFKKAFLTELFKELHGQIK